MYEKKGVSGVIATVLTILLTIVVVGILSAVIIPFTKDNLEDSTNCDNIAEGLDIVHDESCYDLNQTNVTIKFGNIKSDEIYIVASSGGNSQSFQLKNNVIPPSGIDDSILPNGDAISLPIGGGKRKFVINARYEEIEVGSVSNGKRCSIIDDDKLFSCINP